MPESTVNQHYYNCSFYSTNSFEGKKKENIGQKTKLDEAEEEFKTLIKNIAKETNQVESLVEYIIKLFIESNIE